MSTDLTRDGDEWQSLPKGVPVAALPDGLTVMGAAVETILGTDGNQADLVSKIQGCLYAHERAPIRLLALSKPHRRMLREASAQLSIQQHYCYAAFIS
jgi:hypothetical protein